MSLLKLIHVLFIPLTTYIITSPNKAQYHPLIRHPFIIEAMSLTMWYFISSLQSKQIIIVSGLQHHRKAKTSVSLVSRQLNITFVLHQVSVIGYMSYDIFLIYVVNVHLFIP